MNKKNAVVAVALLMAVVSIKAQIFVGGALGFSSTKMSSTTGSTTTELGKISSYNFSPEVGYYLSENLAIGLGFGVGNTKTTTPITTTSNSVNDQTNWNIRPFARYTLLKTGGFGFFGEGALSFGGSSSETTNGSTTTDGPSTTTISIGLFPGITYDLSDKVALIAKVGALSYATNKSKITTGTGAGASTTETSTPNFTLALNLNTISFGAIVKL